MTTKEINPTNEKSSRLFFVDHLRAALVILVVLHHVAMVYGGIQPFYYLEPQQVFRHSWCPWRSFF